MQKYAKIVEQYMFLTGASGCDSISTEEEYLTFETIVIELKWNKIREKRNQLLAETDYLMLGDVWNNMSNKQQSDILAYRQALRDLPSTITDIDNVIYPEKP